MLNTTSIDSYTLLWLEWSIGSILVCISGLLVLNYSDLLPNFVHRMVKYGKSADAHDVKIQFLELPKRYFFHFYSVALIFYLFLASMVINIYFDINLFGDSLHSSSSVIKNILDKFTNYDYLAINYQRIASVSPESVIIGLSMLIVQVARRLCECVMVSVYSNAKMNIIHYMFGHLFYIGVGLSMLAEAPGFTGPGKHMHSFRGRVHEKSITQSSYQNALLHEQISTNQRYLTQDHIDRLSLDPSNSCVALPTRFNSSKFEFLTSYHMIGVALFAWSSYVQFDSHRILANLRKDTRGRIYTTKHSIPKGKWFDLVSSPHYMAEILIYLAITIVLSGKSLTWWMVFLFVVTNQIFVGMFNHSWYLKTFDDYPKSRRAIIPYVL